MSKLSERNLNDLPPAVKRPGYDRSALSAGILHIGVGNFHRAHQAWYLHRLFQAGVSLDWAIVGAGVRPYDVAQRERLAAQDHLTTLIELDPAGNQVEVVGSMIDYVGIAADNGPLIARMACPDIRIVSLTVTESGYYMDPATKGFDSTHPDIRHDAENPSSPRTAFGAIVAALRQRRESGVGPLTGLCCDNLQGNGAVLRQTVVSLARMSDPGLADWIDAECSFPNGMVDCIVPATGPKERELVRSLGIEDDAPVTHENFRQWVIEDDFCAGRPALEQAGVVFTPSVHAHERMKIRILNGGHQVLANGAELLGVETIADCMADPRLSGLFDKVVRQDIVPHVAPVPGMTPEAYVDLIAKRFSNTRIVDTTRRVAFDGSARHPGFVIPSLRDGLEAGSSVEGLALVEALWARMCAGTREDGSEIPPNDPVWEDLQGAAHGARTDPGVWIGQGQYYGELGADPRFARAFATWLQMIWSDGTGAAIAAYLAK